MFKPNEIMQRKKNVHRRSLNYRKSRIQEMAELPNVAFGEVMGIYDCTSHAFIVRNGKIEISDLLGKRARIDFVYNTSNGSLTGKGTVNHFAECERLVAYVLLLIETLDE